MFSCRKASQLVSESLDRELSLGERFSLRFHLCICSMCRKFKKQVELLHLLLGDPPPAVPLPPEARQRLQSLLERTE